MWGSGFMFQVDELRVERYRFLVEDFGLRVYGLGVQALGSRV